MNLSWKNRRVVPLVAVVAALWLSSSAIAQESVLRRDRILTVTGRGSRLVPTEKTRVQLGVVVEGKTAGEVQAEIAQRTNAIVSRLRGLQVERLQTTSITLNPKYIYESNRQIQDGFIGQSNVSFVTTNNNAGGLLDAAIAAGANRVEQVSFIAPDAAISTARNQALQDATKDALSQAEAVLTSLNLRQTSIRSIQIGEPSGASPIMQNRVQNLSAGDTSTPIVGGEQRVEVYVVIEIGY
jgi:uncharacterized protein YggE